VTAEYINRKDEKGIREKKEMNVYANERKKGRNR
jgi:hypothetical protein